MIDSPLAAVAALLECPVCRSSIDLDSGALLCVRGHSFDVARQGYVSLSVGAPKFSGDTADMLAARGRFLDSGHFAPITAAILDATGSPSTVLEVGAGTGHYVAAVLDARPDAVGIGIDVAKPAGRRLARMHPRLAAVVADGWQRLPLRDNSIDVALSIFAPRNTAEIRRVLTSEGTFVVVTPTPRHLAELIDPLGMVAVDTNKAARLSETMSATFERCERRLIEHAVQLDHGAVDDVVAMGPSAFHMSPGERAERIARLPNPVTVTVSVVLQTYRPRMAITSA
ncbi:methyltransferase domain-containing protein [Skermania sp. ID1734]|uniref:putative RNA methyltransferase n=1 Tax=Skermania sp. ID1734 TaxID=2597516 RepID=UPI001180A1D4|nr:methyltransferase domain-containing protein [Skermania sp. ID1734]TSE01913.1 methyltransferase domain-containing protein [Skermania sp. ID1734]